MLVRKKLLNKKKLRHKGLKTRRIGAKLKKRESNGRKKRLRGRLRKKSRKRLSKLRSRRRRKKKGSTKKSQRLKSEHRCWPKRKPRMPKQAILERC